MHPNWNAMKKTISLLAMVSLCAVGTAQNENDALRYSLTSFGGSARATSMAGAFGALGGDMSAMSYNPAGIGVYRRSEFSFSTGLDFTNTETSYLGGGIDQTEPNLNISSIGLVGTYETQASGWRHVQFGLAYNRLQTFHSDYTISGTQAETTLLDVFAEQAAGIDPNNLYDSQTFGAGQAYNTWLIDPVDSLGSSYTHRMPDGNRTQTFRNHTGGRVGETAITFAGNYDDRVYIGGGIAFPGVRYSEESVYEENASVDTMDLDRFTYAQSLETRGTGFNAKFGIIVRPVDFLRVGIAVHSPTWYSMTDSWSTTMHSYYQPGTGPTGADEFTDVSPQGRYDYRIITPSKVLGSLALVVGKSGVISADYEYIDYSSARLRSSNTANLTGNSYGFTDENAQIDQQFVAASNLRVGTEWRFNPFRIRAGYALYGNPYKNDATFTDGTRTTYTFGLGFRDEGYFVDLGYSLTEYESDYYLYDPSKVQAATLTNSIHRYVLTVGFRY